MSTRSNERDFLVSWASGVNSGSAGVQSLYGQLTVRAETAWDAAIRATGEISGRYGVPGRMIAITSVIGTTERKQRRRRQSAEMR